MDPQLQTICMKYLCSSTFHLCLQSVSVVHVAIVVSICDNGVKLSGFDQHSKHF
jgi:hypothetical protein